MAYKFNPLTGNLDDYGPVLTGTGTVSAAADGTAALPGIAFTNDLNTGIYRPGADQLALSTNGTGRLFIDASGNIGVGTASTGNTITFPNNGSIGFAGAIGQLSTNCAFSSGADRYLASAESTRYYQLNGAHIWQTASAGTAGNAITFNERLRITSAGLVGIGTSSPSSLLHLSSDLPILTFTDVNDAASSRVYQDDNLFVIDVDNANAKASSVLAFRVDNTERARIDSSGRLGIGTASPSSPLHVEGNILANKASGNTGITAQSGSILCNISSQDGVGHFVYGTGAYPLTFSTNATERARIDSSGRLGIGTTSASGILHTKAATNQFIGEDSATGNIFAIQNTGGATTLNSYLSTTGRAPIVFTQYTSECGRWDASGRLLVGTASTSSVNRLIVQSSSDAPTGAGTLFLARGDNAPLTTNVLGALRFGGSTHVNSAEISAFRDGGTWTAGSSLPTGLTFSTTSDGQASPTPRLTITSTGQVRLAGAGITFNGDTAAANELDDYEEGTFTPTVVGTTTAGTATYAAQIGRYTKIGNLVNFTVYLSWSGGTGSGDLKVNGLPFTINSESNRLFACSVAWVEGLSLTAGHVPQAALYNNETRINIQSYPTGGTSFANVAYDAGAAIAITGSYTV